MNDIKKLQQIATLIRFIDNVELKGLIIKLVTLLRNDDELNDMDLLKLFDYEVIKNEYHLIRDIIELITEYFNINKYSDIINIIRVNNGLKYDDEYLKTLTKKLKDSNNDLFKNNRFEGLFNLLNDNNLIYNNVGLRILIIKYLLDIDIKKLNVFILSNSQLNDEYKHLVYKNDKIKFYSKLYFIKGDIILSTLEHDNIINTIYTLNDNINYCYGGKIDKQTNDINDIVLKSNDNKLIYESNDEKILRLISELFDFLGQTNEDYINFKGYDIRDLYFDDIPFYLDILNKKDNVNNFYRYDKIYNKYLDILKILNDDDEFKSNELKVNQNKDSIITSLFDEYLNYDSI